MSPSLFTNTVRTVMTVMKVEWERKGYGTVIGSNVLGRCRFAYAMFADATTLVAKSRQALVRMLNDITDALARVGLHMNESKCSIQCAGMDVPAGKALRAGQRQFPRSSCVDSFEVLGTIVTINGNAHAEFANRLRAAWAKYRSLRSLLQKRTASERKRLLLFESTVSKTALWCAESWKLTVAQMRKLRSTQRRMFRTMVGPRRRPEEDHVSWIKRATAIADRTARSAGVRC